MQTDSPQSHNYPLSFYKNKQTLVQFDPNCNCGYAKSIQSESIFWSLKSHFITDLSRVERTVLPFLVTLWPRHYTVWWGSDQIKAKEKKKRGGSEKVRGRGEEEEGGRREEEGMKRTQRCIKLFPHRRGGDKKAQGKGERSWQREGERERKRERGRREEREGERGRERGREEGERGREREGERG